MLFSPRFRRQLCWLNLPSPLLLALLQRMPALKLAGVVDEFLTAAPLAAVLRPAFAGAAAMGALHSMAGATRAISFSAPTIALQPVSQTVNAGSTLTIYVIATGNPAPTYQWRKNGVFLAGANLYYLTLANVQSADAAMYTVLVSNALGGVVSNGSIVTVITPAVAPLVTFQPASQTVIEGTTVTFAASASGSPAPTFQWQKDGVAIPGAVNSSLTLGSVQLADAGNYAVVAANSAGAVTSNAAMLTVNPAAVAPAIMVPPAGQTVTVGADVVFTAAASGSPAPAYQWQRNGANLPGATNSSLSLPGVQLADAASYAVVATNVAGSAISTAATLSVNPAPAAPVVATSPSSQTVNPGANVTLTVVASGTPAPTFQWLRDGAVIPGATNSSLTLTHVLRSAAATYSAVATNQLGSVTSTGAVLRVNPMLGDLDGDGRADIILTNTVTGDRAAWLMSGTGISAGAAFDVLSPNWVFSATGDFDGDGKTDIFLTNSVTGERAIWLMNGMAISAGAYLDVLSTNWTISGSGDFDGDGKSDLVLSNSVTGERAIWLMNGMAISSGAYLGVLPTNWTISGTGDFDGDGKSDLVLTNTATGERAVWLMNGTSIGAGAYLGVLSTDWSISGTGDFNGDGRSDILLTNTVTGERAVWLMNGTTFSGTSIAMLSPAWAVSAIGDYDGDGKSDIFLTNTLTGERALWLMDGTRVRGITLGLLSTDWLIAR